MKISVEEVEKIANMSRLYLAREEVGPVADQLSRILDYIDILEEVDVQGVVPSSSPSFTENVFREDEVRPGPGPEATFANAPDQDDDFYLVPRVVK